jgi:hypothetical protein
MIASRELGITPMHVTLVVLCAVVGILTAVLPAGALILLLLAAAALILLQLPYRLPILFLAFLVLQDPLRFAAGGDDTAIGFFVKRGDEALLLALAGWTLLTNRRTREALRARGMRWAILGCLAGILASSLAAHTKLIPSAVDLLLFSKPFMIFAIGCSIVAEDFANERRVTQALTPMMAVILFAVVFLALPNLHDAYLGSMRVADTRLGLRSAQSFFDGPGPYSWFCATAFAIAYAAYLAFERRRFAVMAVIAAAFTVLSWRRKSIGGILAMILLSALVRSGRDSRSRQRAVLTLALVALVGVTVLAPLVSSLWDFTIREYGGDPNSVARFALHHTSLLIARDRFPFGAGLASFGSYASSIYYSDVYVEYGLANVWGLNPQYPAFITDTFWPMVLGEGGVVTLIPYVFFILMPVGLFWRTSRAASTSPDDRFLAFAGLFILMGSLLESTSSPIYSSTMQSALALIVPGIAWSHFTLRERTERERPDGS